MATAAELNMGTMSGDLVDPGAKVMFRVGGVSALVLGVAYVIIIPLFAHVGAPPTGGEAWLKYLAGKTIEWWVILGLSVVTDLLYIPLTLALYLALNRINRNAMLVATTFVGLFIVLDLAITWSNYAALLGLSYSYAAATNAVQRSAYVTAANYPSAVLSSRLEVVYAIMLLSSGILVIGLVMLKGRFGKITAYLALATGVLGIVSIAGFGATVILNAVSATAWVLVVGYKLYRLGDGSSLARGPVGGRERQ